MNRTARTTAVALALGAGLLLSACSSPTEDEGQEPAATASEAPVDETGPVEVPDVVLLILETAQGNLMRSDLEATVVDEAGAAVTIDDPTAWLVTAQDPAEGEVERGSSVTLTVKARD